MPWRKMSENDISKGESPVSEEEKEKNLSPIPKLSEKARQNQQILTVCLL